MAQQQPNDDKVRQDATNVGGNATQVGRDSTNRSSVNFVIPLFFISILALGGLAWALAVGLNQGGQTPQSIPTSQPTNPSTKTN